MGNADPSPSNDYTVDSWLVSAGRDRDQGAPLNIPILPASNFVHGTPRAYSRDDGTRSWEALEEIVGGLEGGRALAFSSGMAAISAVFQQMAAGSLVVIPEDCYQGVTGLVRRGEHQLQWRVRRIAVAATADWLRASEEADLIWLESPSNPLLHVADLQGICAARRKPGALLGVDNTFSEPVEPATVDARCGRLGAIGDQIHRRPFRFVDRRGDGAQSVALPCTARGARTSGSNAGALETFLAIRGARTMALRLARMQATAMTLAQRLSAHPAVAVTRYPGLPTHNGHESKRVASWEASERSSPSTCEAAPPRRMRWWRA